MSEADRNIIEVNDKILAQEKDLIYIRAAIDNWKSQESACIYRREKLYEDFAQALYVGGYTDPKNTFELDNKRWWAESCGEYGLRAVRDFS